MAMHEYWLGCRLLISQLTLANKQRSRADPALAAEAGVHLRLAMRLDPTLRKRPRYSDIDRSLSTAAQLEGALRKLR